MFLEKQRKKNSNLFKDGKYSEYRWTPRPIQLKLIVSDCELESKNHEKFFRQVKELAFDSYDDKRTFENDIEFTHDLLHFQSSSARVSLFDSANTMQFS